MKRILIPTTVAALSVMGVAGFAQAGGTHSQAYPPPTTQVAVLPPEPILTVPPASPLPVTGADSSDTIAIAAVAVAVGGGLVLVARSRRRPTKAAS